jgi:hypothetical protein
VWSIESMLRARVAARCGMSHDPGIQVVALGMPARPPSPPKHPGSSPPRPPPLQIQLIDRNSDSAWQGPGRGNANEVLARVVASAAAGAGAGAGLTGAAASGRGPPTAPSDVSVRGGEPSQVRSRPQWLSCVDCGLAMATMILLKVCQWGPGGPFVACGSVPTSPSAAGPALARSST